MEEEQIVALFLQRNEDGILYAGERYSRGLTQLADRILGSREDSEECVNEALLAAWNAIPPHRPERLGAFLAKLTRRIAIDRYRAENRKKRKCPGTELALWELQDCVPARSSLEEYLQGWELTQMLNRFLWMQKPRNRQIFLCRYFYQMSVEEIGTQFQISQSNVKSCLLRTRRRLKAYLEQEGMIP